MVGKTVKRIVVFKHGLSASERGNAPAWMAVVREGFLEEVVSHLGRRMF